MCSFELTTSMDLQFIEIVAYTITKVNKVYTR